MLKKIGFAAAGLLLLASPLLASATSPLPSDDYGNGDNSSGIYCPNLLSTIQKGARGAQVSELQAFLTDYFNLDENVVVGGYFGKLTQSYLIQFQQQQGLPAFGIAGSLTRAKIAEVCGGGGTPNVTVDIKVAGLDGPITIQKNTIAMVSWKTSGMSYCQISGARGTEVLEKGLESGSLDVRIDESGVFSMKCSTYGGATVFDQVQVNTTGTAYGPTCTYASGSTLKTNDIYVDSNMTFEICKSQCRIVRNEKFGSKDSGMCTFVNSSGSSQSAWIDSGTPYSGGITVTAPNGGESWRIGDINTITWTPYQYGPDINPSKDVTAYLEMKSAGGFVTVGKVIEDGRASIHWSGMIDQWNNFAKPGSGYYIRVVNNVTGASDRSDAPFALVPRPAILGAYYGYMNDQLFISTQNISEADALANCRMNAANNPSARVRCTWNGNEIFSNGGSAASLQITSPNGGEQILGSGLTLPVRWTEKGVGKASIALYKNDQWYSWIAKDMPAQTLGENREYTWNFGGQIADGYVGKNIFKIYITGQKADGSGYIDDKSDAPFSFVGSTITTPYFFVSPKSGPVPLTIGYKGGVTCNLVSGLTISYGDGVSEGGFLPTACTTGISGTHTYQTPGTYFLNLNSGTSNIGGTYTIVVTGDSSSSFSASPTSGTAPLTVHFQIPQSLCNGSLQTLYYGDGQQTSLGACMPDGTYVAKYDHTYTTAGSYSATVIDSASRKLALAGITVTAGQVCREVTKWCKSDSEYGTTCSDSPPAEPNGAVYTTTETVCTTASSGQTSSLANALTALENALKALIGNLK